MLILYEFVPMRSLVSCVNLSLWCDKPHVNSEVRSPKDSLSIALVVKAF